MAPTRSFKLNINDLLPKALHEVRECIEQARTKLEDIRFLDLLVEDRDAEWPRGMNHGVYLLFNPSGQCAYVGRTMDGFAKRMGEHFYTRGGAKNQYLARTIEQHKANPEFADYARQAAKMGDHGLVMVNVHVWESVQKHLKDAGVPDPTQFDGHLGRGGRRELWGAQVFCDALELTLQSAYCPADRADDGRFLVKRPGRGRLRRNLQAMQRDDNKNKNLAQLVAMWARSKK